MSNPNTNYSNPHPTINLFCADRRQIDAVRHRPAHMRVTVRLDDDQAAHVDAMRQDSDESDADAVRNCIGRSQRLDDLKADHEERVATLAAEIDDLEAELREERSRADELTGELRAKEETIDAKQHHIDSLESTIAEQQATVIEAVGNRQSTLGRIRRALTPGDDERQE